MDPDPVTILSVVAAVISLKDKFENLITKEKLGEKDKEGFLGKLGELQETVRIVKNVYTQVADLAGENMGEWLSTLEKTQDMNVIESTWKRIRLKFDKCIADGIEDDLPRMKEVALKRVPIKLNAIPANIREQSRQLAHVYPQLIALIEDFALTVRKQSEEIDKKMFANVRTTAPRLETQVKRIKTLANTVIRDLRDIFINAFKLMIKPGDEGAE